MIKISIGTPVGIAFYNAKQFSTPSEWLLAEGQSADLRQKDLVHISESEFYQCYMSMDRAIQCAMSVLDAAGTPRDNVGHINLSNWEITLRSSLVSTNMESIRNLASMGLVSKLGYLSEDISNPSIEDFERFVSNLEDGSLGRPFYVTLKVLLPSSPIKAPETNAEKKGEQSSEYYELFENESCEVHVLDGFSIQMDAEARFTSTNM